MPTDVRLKFVATGMAELRRAPHLGTGGTRNAADETGTTRLHAEAIKRILDPDTGEIVGWLYQWNTGAVCPRWKSEPREHVIYE